MRVKLLNIYQSIRTSMWLIPTLMSIGALLLALLSSQFDEQLLRSAGSTMGDKWFIYKGEVSGAQTLLSAVAGSMITVAGVVFSVTMVALSTTTSQFGPRLLVNFMRDPGNQMVLGTFIATFLYCLIAISVDVPLDQQIHYRTSAVPVAVVLSALSLATLIYFFHHVASSLRAENVIDNVVRNLFASVSLLTPKDNQDHDDRQAGNNDVPDFSSGRLVRSRSIGYLQALDEDSLLEIASDCDLVIQVLVRPGHFVAREQAVARLSPSNESDAQDLRILDCFIVGRFRSDEQDPEFGVSQLVEVALRALSPGINDPYTAITCVDWLGAIIASVADKPFRAGQRRGNAENLRLILDPVSFEGLVDAAFSQIRQHSTQHIAVALRLLEALFRIAEAVDVEMKERFEPLKSQARAIYDTATSQLLTEIDKREFDRRYNRLMQQAAIISP